MLLQPTLNRVTENFDREPYTVTASVTIDNLDPALASQKCIWTLNIGPTNDPSHRDVRPIAISSGTVGSSDLAFSPVNPRDIEAAMSSGGWHEVWYSVSYAANEMVSERSNTQMSDRYGGGGQNLQCPPLGSFDTDLGGYFDVIPYEPAPQTQMKLVWVYVPTDADGDGAPDCPHEGYNVYREGQLIATLNVDDLAVTWVDGEENPLNPDTEYCYQVIPYNVDGEASASPSACARTQSENQLPVAEDDEITVVEDGSVTSAFNGYDPDNYPQSEPTYMIIEGPSHGAASTDGILYTYTPSPGYFGEDSFTWSIYDGELSATATVLIAVTEAENQPPIAFNSSEETEEEVILSSAATASDPDEDPLTWEVVDSPQFGTLVGGVNPDTGVYRYQPEADYNGEDYFTFRVYDGNLYSNVATVTIIVTPVNDAPVITVTGDNPYIVTWQPRPGDGGEIYTDPGATAVDVEDGNLDQEIEVSGDVVERYHSGSYRINYSVEDSEGASDTDTRDVKVTLEPATISAENGDPSHTHIDLNWTSPPAPQPGDNGYNGTSTIHYTLYCQQAPEPGIIATHLAVTAYTDDGSWSDEGSLEPDGEYEYWVVRQDHEGNYEDSVFSNTVEHTTTEEPVAPSAWYLSILDNVPEPWTQCHLDWSPIVPDESNIDGFRIYHRELPTQEWALIHTVDIPNGNPLPGETQYVVNGLTPATQNEFYVVAFNEFGDSPNSNVVEWTTLAVPTGMETADMDERGELGVLTCTGVFYEGWGYCTTDPGDETDVTAWPDVTLITTGAMSDSATYPAGAHEVWVAAIGWGENAHYIGFNTYNGIQGAFSAELQQDNVTVSCSVPHVGDSPHTDWVGIYYSIDYAAWSGTPGTSLGGTQWVNGLPDEDGNFDIDLSDQLPGVYDIRFIGSYNEDGVSEQCGDQTDLVEITKYPGIEDIRVNVHGNDGESPNIEIGVWGLGPDTPHGWRFSIYTPPLDENGDLYADLNDWENSVFVPGAVTYDPTTAEHTVDSAGNYTMFAIACWEDGTPIRSYNLPGGFAHYVFSVRPHPYTGFTDVTLTYDGPEVVITVEGDYHHWHYSVGKLFTGSRPRHLIAGEGVMVPTGNTARFTPDHGGRGIVYVAGVDPRHHLIPGGGPPPSTSQPVWSLVYRSQTQANPPVPPPPGYDPAAIPVPNGEFGMVPLPGAEEGDPPIMPMMTSTEFSAALGYTTEVSFSAFMTTIPDATLTPLLAFYYEGGPAVFTSGALDWDVAVADSFVVADTTILAAVATVNSGVEDIAAAVDFPISFVTYRTEYLYHSGSIDFSTYSAVMNSASVARVTGLDENGDPVVENVPWSNYSWDTYVPLEAMATVPLDSALGAGNIIEPERENFSDFRAAMSYFHDGVNHSVDTVWLYDNEYHPRIYAPAVDGAASTTFATTYVETFIPRDFSNRGSRFCPKVNTTATVSRCPWLAGGFIEDPRISSVATDREDLTVSSLPGTPGPLWYLSYINVNWEWPSIAGTDVVARGDIGDWTAYVCYKEWMGVDPDTLVVLDLGLQQAYLQDQFDSEWFANETYEHNGQQREDWLVVVHEEAIALGFDLNYDTWTPPGDG